MQGHLRKTDRLVAYLVVVRKGNYSVEEPYQVYEHFPIHARKQLANLLEMGRSLIRLDF